MITLPHGRIELALHELKGSGTGHPLLCLHGLGVRSPGSAPAALEAWPGPIHALDFTGHGASTVPTGGGYTAELLMGDVDAALEHLGPATLLGFGLGAYVALLSSAGRSDVLRGAILCDGPGIAGGGPAPGTPALVRIDTQAPAPPDQFALGELSKDIRPPDYAVDFVRIAIQNSPLAHPIAVCARARPEWLVAVMEEAGIAQVPLSDALAIYASSAGDLA